MDPKDCLRTKIEGKRPEDGFLLFSNSVTLVSEVTLIESSYPLTTVPDKGKSSLLSLIIQSELVYAYSSVFQA